MISVVDSKTDYAALARDIKTWGVEFGFQLAVHRGVGDRDQFGQGGALQGGAIRPGVGPEVDVADADAVVEAAGKALSETALEKVMVSKQTLGQLGMADQPETQWQELWPKTAQTQRH